MSVRISDKSLVMVTIGVFRVTKIMQNWTKTDFSKLDQNKKGLCKTYPKQLFCHWANRAPTQPKHTRYTISKLIPTLGYFLNSVDTNCTVTLPNTSVYLLCLSPFLSFVFFTPSPPPPAQNMAKDKRKAELDETQHLVKCASHSSTNPEAQ